MAIELIEDLKTVRTYPRLMKHKESGDMAIAALDSSIVWLSGFGAGTTIPSTIVARQRFEDFHGSVTLHNKD